MLFEKNLSRHLHFFFAVGNEHSGYTNSYTDTVAYMLVGKKQTFSHRETWTNVIKTIHMNSYSHVQPGTHTYTLTPLSISFPLLCWSSSKDHWRQFTAWRHRFMGVYVTARISRTHIAYIREILIIPILGHDIAPLPTAFPERKYTTGIIPRECAARYREKERDR